jgi:hypothetical protein
MFASTEFIELNRRFIPLNEGEQPEDMALFSYTRELLGRELGLGWDDLFNNRFVVVLGEPFSGKTWEFKRRVDLMRDERRFAFFIQLDRLIDLSLVDAIGRDDYNYFQKWLHSSHEAFFFLDSVDETKFRKLTDFYTALNRFHNDLDTINIGRTRIILSSRISEWQPKNDLYEVSSLFPLLATSKEKASTPIAQGDQSDKREGIIVVQMEPLDKTRVEAFTRAKNISDADKFLSALEEHQAWEFTRRPGDVVDLLKFWKEQKRFGSLSELIEHDVRFKLQLPKRDNDSLSSDQLYEGVKSLAAATMFCRQFNFKVPEDNSDSLALDANKCLQENWSKQQSSSLLMRPLFDSASYGHIRFHHRRIAEYLTAQWLEDRLYNRCPVMEINNLLFEHSWGKKIIRKGLAPIAAWLCCGSEPWNEDIRNWVLEAAPDIHLQYGDPSRLPIEYKRKILAAIVERFKGRERVWIESSPESLKRIADPALAEDAITIIRNRDISADIRKEILQLVRYGRLKECLSIALELIATPDESLDIRIYAAATIRDAGDKESRQKLVQIANQLPNIPNYLCGEICEALYPDVIDSCGLIDLLRKTEPVPDSSVDLNYQLSSHFESVLKPDQAHELLLALLDLGRTPPYILHDSKETNVSAQFSWLGEVIPVVLRKLFSITELSEEEIAITVTAISFLGQIHRYSKLHTSKFDELNIATGRHPSLRRHYFWNRVKERRQQEKDEPRTLVALYDYYEVIKPLQDDIDWMVQDIQGMDSIRDRELVLCLASDLIRRSKQKDLDRNKIKKAIVRDTHLKSFYHRQINGPTLWLKRLWYRNIHWKLGDKWWWIDKWRKLKQSWTYFNDQYKLIIHLKQLITGKNAAWLSHLCREADEKNIQRYTPSTWDDLTKKRGRLITWATRKGCKHIWRTYKPNLPHESVNGNRTYGIIAGLAGIQATLADKEINLAKMNYEDAYRASRYAVNELNGFATWFKDLACFHPDAVREVLVECIRGEWQFTADRKDVNEVLQDLVWQGDDLVPLVEKSIIELLKNDDPPNPSILRLGLSLLMRRNIAPSNELGIIASERIKRYPVGSKIFLLWLTVWLQTDAAHAINFLNELLNNYDKAVDLMLNLCAVLKGDRFDKAPVSHKPDYEHPVLLRRFIVLVFRYIRPEDDESYGPGVFTPTARHDVQDFRGRLLDRLANSTDPQATIELKNLLSEPAMVARRDFILHLIENREETQADLEPWKPEDVRSFQKDHEIDPKTDRDLFKLVIKRLQGIKYDVEKADNSLREEVRIGDPEPILRRWLQRKLVDRNNNRYTVPQEEEIDQQDRPDLRIENPNTDPVSIEIKWAERWTLSTLIERLENQLVGQYLRAHNSRYGIYFIGMIGHNKEKSCKNDQEHSFEQVIEILKARAKAIVESRNEVEGLEVIGIDFRNPKDL